MVGGQIRTRHHRGKVVHRRTEMTIEKPEKLKRLEDLGPCLEEGKALLAKLQTLLVSQQCERDQETYPPCAGLQRSGSSLGGKIWRGKMGWSRVVELPAGSSRLSSTRTVSSKKPAELASL